MSGARPAAPRSIRVLTVFAFLVLYLPLMVLVVTSFLGPKDALGNREWSLHWYRLVLANELVIGSLVRSVQVGLWSTLFSVVLGTSLALVLARHSFRGKAWLDALLHIPLIMPELVLGLALLIWFVILKVTLGTASIVLAHVTFSLSYVIITVRARLHGFDLSLEEAAQDLGATPWQTFWKVTFPLIWPGVLSGGLMAFTLSFDDFLITFFTAGVGSDTLPLKIYSMIKFGVSPEINALSTLLLLITFVLVLFFFQPPKRRRGRRSSGAVGSDLPTS